MAVYHQMGHDSENLLHAEHLDGLSGAILSPVNYQREGIAAQIARARDVGGFDTVFDPQLYFPRTQRGVLREWAYFPTDVDTADITSTDWWNAVTDSIAAECSEIRPSAVCSPAVVPTVFTDEYFAMLVRAGNRLSESLNGTQIRAILTAVVGLADLSVSQRSLAVASILSRSKVDEVYLVLTGNSDPRRELNNPEELKGAMRLISVLEQSGIRVIVGFCSSDLVLWKAAGAAVCATGKFFNLRRFTPARFEEPPLGGGQLAYWFEESLMAFVRESDLIRLSQRNLLGESRMRNPFGMQILDQLSSQPGAAWVALGWRQFMFWFADMEVRLTRGTTDVSGTLQQAEANWRTLEDSSPPILMEEPRNDGSWVRAWRRALVEFPYH